MGSLFSSAKPNRGVASTYFHPDEDGDPIHRALTDDAPPVYEGDDDRVTEIKDRLYHLRLDKFKLEKNIAENSRHLNSPNSLAGKGEAIANHGLPAVRNRDGRLNNYATSYQQDGEVKIPDHSTSSSSSQNAIRRQNSEYRNKLLKILDEIRENENYLR